MIRTVIVDRSPLVRAGLKHILDDTRFRVCFECPDLQDLPEGAIRDRQPNLVLIGISIPSEQDLSRIQGLKKIYDCLLVVVLAEGRGQENFLAAMDAGADGYLAADNVSTDMLLKALDLVMSRAVVIPLALMGSMKDRAREPLVIDVDRELDISEHTTGHLALTIQDCSAIALPSSAIALSKREQLILWHLTQGAPNKQIARELAVAEATVKVHVKAILRKIRVRNRTQAAIWAIGNGLTLRNPLIWLLAVLSGW